MSARGYPEGRSIQAPGMMRHGPAPSLVPSIRHPMDTRLPPPEILENNLAVQGAEMEKLLRENHRLAATHAALRHELLAAQQEMQRVQACAAEVQSESSVQIRSMLEKISKMEADVKAGDAVKKELQQAHVEAQGLVAIRMELSVQIQQATDELQRMHSDIKKLPELHSEIGGLMQEHQKLRATFEREKGGNMEIVQKMHAMENNLLSMTREVEKLRSEVQDAEKRAQAPTLNPYQSPYGAADPPRNPYGAADPSRNPYGAADPSRNPYGTQHPSHNPSQDAGYGQSGAYLAGAYNQGAAYANGGYAQATSVGQSDPYGRTSQVQMMGGATGEKLHGSGGAEKENPYGSSMPHAAYSSAQGGAPSAYDSAMGAAASYGAGAYGYDRAAAVGGAYDSSGAAAPSANAYESARGAAAGGSTTIHGDGYSGSYGAAAMGGANTYGMYEAARAEHMPIQR